MANRLSVAADTASIVLSICALGLLANHVWQSRSSERLDLRRESLRVDNWEQYAIGRRIGPADASVVIVEWGDYQCAACQWFAEHLSAAIGRFPSEVAVVYRHWPLPSHRYAYSAARAAECAGEQGAFEAYHQALYGDPNWLGDAFIRFAREAEVEDAARFQDCIDDVQPVESIERDIRAVMELGGRGTPTLLVNGLWLATTPDSTALIGLIEGMLNEKGER